MEGAVQYLGQYAIKASLVAAAYFAPCQEVIGIVFLVLGSPISSSVFSPARTATHLDRRAECARA